MAIYEFINSLRRLFSVAHLTSLAVSGYMEFGNITFREAISLKYEHRAQPGERAPHGCSPKSARSHSQAIASRDIGAPPYPHSLIALNFCPLRNFTNWFSAKSMQRNFILRCLMGGRLLAIFRIGSNCRCLDSTGYSCDHRIAFVRIGSRRTQYS
jgi:hypothetical protein